MGPEVLASGFHIVSIGEVETKGIQSSKFWHTSGRPTIRGMSLPGEEVVINIDGLPYTINADSSGEWFFTPVESLSEGDHAISITGQGSNIDFTLTTGVSSVDYASIGKGGGQSGTLPTVGVVLPTLLLLGGGGGLTILGKKFGR